MNECTFDPRWSLCNQLTNEIPFPCLLLVWYYGVNLRTESPFSFDILRGGDTKQQSACWDGCIERIWCISPASDCRLGQRSGAPLTGSRSGCFWNNQWLLMGAFGITNGFLWAVGFCSVGVVLLYFLIWFFVFCL